MWAVSGLPVPLPAAAASMALPSGRYAAVVTSCFATASTPKVRSFDERQWRGKGLDLPTLLVIAWARARLLDCRRHALSVIGHPAVRLRAGRATRGEEQHEQ